ncbi:Cytokine-dependent hematopoietic cell linker [Microtus ochrogaster]|uniref:Cytokine-dependent hematopoietic cell linker n=1 Tax=Microtus ochrogaster TaxID=79684 RepID=A0A8J6GRA2_MICOH|nr:Cytokine-dependent hematopoietic cell linker [Microtus ochrogaster]
MLLQATYKVSRISEKLHYARILEKNILSHINQRRNLAAILDEGKCHSDDDDDDYEDPGVQLPKAWPSMKILPARPIQESEYADTRYFKDMMEAPLLLPPKVPAPTGKPSWNAGMRRQEEVFFRDKPISKDVRSQRFKGLKRTEENKTPVPPPRPTITLPKKYQPLPPAPPEISVHFSPRHGFPEVQRGLRQISPKDVCEDLITRKSQDLLIHHKTKPQGRVNLPSPGKTDTMQRCLPQRCQTAVRHGPHDQVLPYENTNTGKPVPTKPDEKDVQKNEWYIGEYSRQAVEEALMKEKKDGTFLVRDCSTKSKAEPYVLVVFYGNKVYNVKIRFLESSQQFALGTGLRGNEMFGSVEDIIEYYKHFPIKLIDGKDKAGVHREQCYLTQPLPLGRLPLTPHSSQAPHD